MTEKSIHFISNEFSRGISHPLDWWKRRLFLYKYFTLNSLVNQTNKNFYLIMTVDNCFPKELLENLENILKETGLKYLLVNRMIKEDFKNKLKTLPEFEYAYSTRIDSDDLFKKDVVEEIQKHEYSHRRALVYQQGYCYDCINQRLQTYFAMSPPFSTIMFPRDIFEDEDKRREYMNIEGHDQVFKKMIPTILSENKYIVLIHEQNDSSIYLENELKLKRYEITREKHDEILKDFSIDSNTHQTMNSKMMTELI